MMIMVDILCPQSPNSSKYLISFKPCMQVYYAKSEHIFEGSLADFIPRLVF